MLNFFMEQKKTPKTKQRIKDCAVSLFNKTDTLSVTTNHIAREAGISPGNLYYHYKNKEDILKDIYRDMSDTFESFQSFDLILKSDNPLKELDRVFDKFGELFFEYRFMVRDLNTLTAIYPELKGMFLKRQKKRIEQIELLIRYFISLGIFEDVEDSEINLRARLNWFISSYWHFFSQTTGNSIEEAIKESKQIVFKINIYPYLTQKGKMMLDQGN